MAERAPITRRRKGRAVRDRVVGLRRVRAGDLAEHPLNWRTHPDKQRRAVRALLGEIGYADALLARETDDGVLQIIDGHLRASLDPDQLVPVLVLDLDEEEAEKLLLTLDPLAALAEADPRPLAELLARTDSSSAAVRDLLQDLARSAHLPISTGLTHPDEIPDIPKDPRSVAGDLWELGAHRILCGDATDPASYQRLLDKNLPELLWTDPPYGVGYVGKTRRALTVSNDDPADLAALLARSFAAIDAALAPGAALYVCHPAGSELLTFLEAFANVGWPIRQTLVWVKDRMVLGHSDYHYRHEGIAYGCKPGSVRGRGRGGWYGGDAEDSVFEIARPSVSRDHPTMKPVELIRRCLRNSAARDGIVLDPFLGSGSTLIAAEEMGCRCAGIELDPRYADVAIRRWEAFTGRKARRRR